LPCEWPLTEARLHGLKPRHYHVARMRILWLISSDLSNTYMESIVWKYVNMRSKGKTSSTRGPDSMRATSEEAQAFARVGRRGSQGGRHAACEERVPIIIEYESYKSRAPGIDQCRSCDDFVFVRRTLCQGVDHKSRLCLRLCQRSLSVRLKHPEICQTWPTQKGAPQIHSCSCIQSCEMLDHFNEAAELFFKETRRYVRDVERLRR
jgi:hypothetical protein